MCVCVRVSERERVRDSFKNDNFVFIINVICKEYIFMVDCGILGVFYRVDVFLCLIN